MSLAMKFAVGVRLQLFEARPDLKTQILWNEDIYGQTHASQVKVFPRNLDRIGLHESDGDLPGRTITIAPRGVWRAVLYCVPDEVLPLTNAAVHYFLNPPNPQPRRIPELIDDVTAWYTSAGKSTQPPGVRRTIDECGTPFDPGDADRSPRTADLLDDPAFWDNLRALHNDRSSRTTAERFIKFVRERGFTGLAAALRAKPATALGLLPTKAMIDGRGRRAKSTAAASA
jgi:hypothetical protein